MSTSNSSTSGPDSSSLREELETVRKGAARARGERLAEQSQEIRKLLDRLVATADSLLDYDLDSNRRQGVETIHDTAEKLASLVDGILDAPQIDPHLETGLELSTEALPAIPASLRILVAEDHLVNRKIVRLMLKSMGLDADFVANGQEAVDRSAENPYDVILMDLRMPRLNGIEAARQIRSGKPATSSPRIVAMSAYALQPIREECSRAGIDGFLSKPVQLDELRRLLADAAATA